MNTLELRTNPRLNSAHQADEAPSINLDASMTNPGLVAPPQLEPGVAAESLSSLSASIRLGILMAFTGLVLIGSLVILMTGSSTNNPGALIGGLICFPLYIAILIGLGMKQEWARVMLIWMTYCGIAGDAIRLLANADRLPGAALALFALGIGLGIVALILAHSAPVKQLTRSRSMAKDYVYQTSAPASQPPQLSSQVPV